MPESRSILPIAENVGKMEVISRKNHFIRSEKQYKKI
jgi:hypothetical protein